MKKKQQYKSTEERSRKNLRVLLFALTGSGNKVLYSIWELAIKPRNRRDEIYGWTSLKNESLLTLKTIIKREK